jgi:steroid 5-alpha reductase family enzyme
MDWGIVLARMVEAALVMSFIMSVAWVVQKVSRQTGWIDVCWTLGTGLAGIFLALFANAPGEFPSRRQVLAAAMAALWSGRLGWHLLNRTLRRGDDPRYRAMLAGWGQDGQRKLFWHAQIQAVIGWLLADCFMIAANNPAPLFRLLDFPAIGLFFLAIAGEALADMQMQHFRAAAGHEQKVCDLGLWRWSRHPNYFFEWLFWLTLPILAIGEGYPQGWLALFAPLCMYWLLVHVSGIPPLETHLAQSRGEAFADYRRRTSRFFPRPPRRSDQDVNRAVSQ